MDINVGVKASSNHRANPNKAAIVPIAKACAIAKDNWRIVGAGL
jgi:hypothetical protein